MSLLDDTSPLLTSCRHLLQASGSINGEDVARTILPLFPSLAAALLSNNNDALGSIDGRSNITHSRIRDFILRDFGPSLHHLGFGKGHRIAVVLPNGPELALSILAIANWATCVPLNANGALSELKADIERCQAHVIFGPASNSVFGQSTSNSFEHVQELARQLDLPFVGLVPSETEAGIFRLVGEATADQQQDNNRLHDIRIGSGGLSPPTSPSSAFRHGRRTSTDSEADVGAGSFSFLPLQEDHIIQVDRFLANGHGDPVILLFTSGTTGSKKIVPHCLGDIMVAAAIISLSWNLTSTDINCNLMPLFHVGGIVRQVFSPVLSGGCVICCPSFDPAIFWDLLLQSKFTWYYAAPTMHQLLLQSRPEHVTKAPPLRMIANAAGGLLPSLARQLRDTFKAHVLPSYGMTECMPIASPPSNYNLEKPGTSGVAVGPQVCILNTTTMKELPRGSEGPICVRGAPCFRGYGRNALEPNSLSQEDAFLEGGWFNTGDLGYMDEDGYLYITGRSKEVINRGGEIISPMEVEEAVVSHPDIKTCAAFSALHDVLQEVVGIVIVQYPDRPRLDLHSLQEFLADKLANPKWPQVMVFMDSLPKSHTNKLLRVRLGQRLGLPEMNDTMYPIERTFHAKCPRQGTPLHQAIPCEQVKVCPQEVQEQLSLALLKDPSQQQLFVVAHPNRLGALVCHAFQVELDHAVHVARDILHRYAVPTHFVQASRPIESERDLSHPKPTDSVGYILQQVEAKKRGESGLPSDPLVTELQQLFQDLLVLDCMPSPDTSFFNVGGSSMLASQLASRIRKKHGVLFSGAEVFQHPTCVAMASLIKEREKDTLGNRGPPSRQSSMQSSRRASVSSGEAPPWTEGSVAGDSTMTGSFHQKDIDTTGVPFTPSRWAPEGSWLSSLFQLIPLFVVFPIWQVSRFFLFFSCLLISLTHTPYERNLLHFIMTLLVYHLVWVTVTPLLFIPIKWIVIGRYQPGRYPFWTSYYLRWWFVDVCRKLLGRGIWGSNEVLLNTYYRMLGASIGANARISLEADVAEFDLVSIGHGAAVEYSTVRGFGVDNGCMILGQVSVGNNASVGARSVVAPYTSIPDGGHLGPVSSSYEVGRSLDAMHARVNRKMLPEPSLFTQIFVGAPITFAVDAISYIPALMVVVWMLEEVWDKDQKFQDMSDLLRWLCNLRRIPFFIGIRVVKSLLSPLVYMSVAILVKWCVIGKFQPGTRNTQSEWQLLRHWLVATLFSRENMQEVADLCGRHYELVSWLYRLLGAKVGKRVFWPGHQPVFSGEFELLEIGDDVVFGSRSSIFCTTVDSCEKVVLCAGSNVSDNCVVLPGSTLGKNAVLGSNSVCPEGWFLPEASVWFGSKGCQPVCLEKGSRKDIDGPLLSADAKPQDLPMIGDESTLRPFGKAFYNGEATYFVLPLGFIVLFTWITQALIGAFHTIPLLAAVHGASAWLYGFHVAYRDYDKIKYSFSDVYIALLGSFFFAHIVRVIAWLAIDLAAKWGFMGQRQEGRYNYDTTSYAQRWELYQIVGKLRKLNRFNILDFICGTPFMNQYFRWNGSKVGKDCCLYPTGADPFMPEPDLVTIGDRCAIDCSSVVCHLNTRGNFELAKIVLEDHVTLRTRSRIQQGVHCERGSMLLEKSLAMTGEVIEADSVWQGAPASRIFVWSREVFKEPPAAPLEIV